MLQAPRILKAPIGCRFSHLSASGPTSSIGVRTATPRIRTAAALTSSSVTISFLFRLKAEATRAFLSCSFRLEAEGTRPGGTQYSFRREVRSFRGLVFDRALDRRLLR